MTANIIPADIPLFCRNLFIGERGVLSYLGTRLEAPETSILRYYRFLKDASQGNNEYRRTLVGEREDAYWPGENAR